MDNEPDCRNCRNKQRYRPNSFFVGDTYYYTYETENSPSTRSTIKGGATVGANASGARSTDLYHISMSSVAVYPKDLGTATAVQRLWDGVWYEKAFKNPDAFYDREPARERILSEDQYVRLDGDGAGEYRPAAGTGADVPEFVSSRVVSQTNKEAEILLYYRSNNQQKITGIGIDGLTTEVLDQYTENGVRRPREGQRSEILYRKVSLYEHYLRDQHGEPRDDDCRLRSGRKLYRGRFLPRDRELFDDWCLMDQYPAENFILVDDLDFTGKNLAAMQVGTEKVPLYRKAKR